MLCETSVAKRSDVPWETGLATVWKARIAKGRALENGRSNGSGKRSDVPWKTRAAMTLNGEDVKLELRIAKFL